MTLKLLAEILRHPKSRANLHRGTAHRTGGCGEGLSGLDVSAGIPCFCTSLGILLSKWEFPKIGVPYFGVLIIRILLFRVLNFGPLFSETPK